MTTPPAVAPEERALPVQESPGEAALEARGLVRHYGPIRAVDGIDVRLGAGEFLTIFGPNGAGKSTLLGLLGGTMRPTSGSVSVCGERCDFGEVSWRRRIGVLSHKGFLYPQLTAEENLRFYARLFGLADAATRVRERLAQVRLEDRAGFRAEELSHGMRQRLALARALLHDPDVVLLDEPYTGLDPSAAAVLRGVLDQLRDGRRTVVMVTHNITEGLAPATRVVIQVAGRFAWSGTGDEARGTDFEKLYHRVVEGRA